MMLRGGGGGATSTAATTAATTTTTSTTVPSSSLSSILRRPPSAAAAHPSTIMTTTAPTTTATAKMTRRMALLAVTMFCLVSFAVLPVLLLEGSGSFNPQQIQLQPSRHHDHVSVHDLMQTVWGMGHPGVGTSSDNNPINQKQKEKKKQQQDVNDILPSPPWGDQFRTTPDGRRLPNIALEHLQPDMGLIHQSTSRGVAGLPTDQTPALMGALRAHIECNELNVDSLAYWNDPTGIRDLEWCSNPPDGTNTKKANNNPFRIDKKGDGDGEKFISFGPDSGGWNNIRMSMEIIFVLAAATGRTLILPPKEPLYLLHHDHADRHRGFADFFPIHTSSFQQRVKVISFAEFYDTVGQHRFPVPTNQNRSLVELAADHCEKRQSFPENCDHVYDYLASVGHVPDISASNCLVFDKNQYDGQLMTDDATAHVNTVCGRRPIAYWDQVLNAHELIHFSANTRHNRLLTHFYGMIHFTDPALDNYYKRFVRDFLHYHDAIYCAAGKIVKAVQAEAISRGFAKDKSGAGSFSAMHVRRGDLQYKKVKISAAEWYQNTAEIWLPGEILYIATDERNKTFFDDLAAHHDLRFLDDYWDLAGLGDLDPNYMGMIDTVVASRGRAFAGTWFSTFSGYITRLRGYHGMSMQDVWYGWLPKKTAVHEWNLVDTFVYAYEFPDGWIGIDGDVWPSHDKF